jgi:hypothetical protein
MDSRLFDRKTRSYYQGHMVRGTKLWYFLCPLCTTQRRVAYAPRPTPRHFFQLGLTAAFFTLVTWHWFSWKGMVSFLPLWTVFEMVYRAKVRAALYCEQCGFDPILYLVDVKRARGEVETFWRKRFEEKGVPYPDRPVAPAPVEPPSSGKLLAATRKIQQ